MVADRDNGVAVPLLRSYPPAVVISRGAHCWVSSEHSVGADRIFSEDVLMARPPFVLFYPVRLEPAEEGGFIVNFPNFAEGWRQGDDREEALVEAADLLETMVANYMAEGWDLPDP